MFVCRAFVYEHDLKSKVHSKSSPAIRSSCTDEGVYTVKRLKDKKTLTSIHVAFDESYFPGFNKSD